MDENRVVVVIIGGSVAAVHAAPGVFVEVVDFDCLKAEGLDDTARAAALNAAVGSLPAVY